MSFFERIGNLHPITLWIAGLALSIASGISGNPYFLLIAIGANALLILLYRSNASGVSSSNLYFWFAGLVVITRLAFRMIFNYEDSAADVLFALPKIKLDLGAVGQVSLLGDISKQTLLGALIDGLRLAAIILSIGMAATLSNPRRLLKSTPAALFEIATAVSVAINLAPQLTKSLQRVHKARSLRGRSKRLGAFTGTLIPALEDSLESSLMLAASMDSRGFGRKGALSGSELIASRLFSLAALVSITFGIFTLLLGVLPVFIPALLFTVGVASAVASMRIASIRNNRTRLEKATLSIMDFLIYGLSATAIFIAMWGWRS